jgi:hypothetical protein
MVEITEATSITPSGWLSFLPGPLALENGLLIIDRLACCKPSTVLYG